jgi:hypothetical protein
MKKISKKRRLVMKQEIVRVLGSDVLTKIVAGGGDLACETTSYTTDRK